MADHPFVGMRGSGDGREPFVIGTGLSVWELVEAVRGAGSVGAAAELLRLSPTLVQAALDYYEEHGEGALGPRDAVATGDTPKTPLERAGQVAGLFTAIAAVVYVAGGVVLATRLYFARVNADAVIGQLPRELLLTIGVGQVLLPVLVLVGAYAGYRLMRGDGARVPKTMRWRPKPSPASASRERLRFLGAALLAATAIVAPGATFAIARRDQLHRPLWWLLVAFLIALSVALVAVEVRARLAERARRRGDQAAVQWSSSRAVWQMSALWAALLVPAAIIFWPAFLQLQEAKVCTTAGFEEGAELIGQTSNGVYLAESRRFERRRVAVLPADQVEEVFIGTGADIAQCDPSGMRGAALASRGAAEARIALAAAKRARSEAFGARGTDRADSLATLVDRVFDVAGDARDVADAADRTTPGVARPIHDAADAAERAAARIPVGGPVAPGDPDDVPGGYLTGPAYRDADKAIEAAVAASKAADEGERKVVVHVAADKP